MKRRSRPLKEGYTRKGGRNPVPKKFKRPPPPPAFDPTPYSKIIKRNKSRSAASRKAWRVRRRMKEARTVTVVHQDGTPVQAGDLEMGRQYEVDMATGILRNYRRALPNPWLDMFK